MNASDLEDCHDNEDQEEMFESINFWMGTVVKLSVASIGITTNLISIPILLNKELTSTFNQVGLTGSQSLEKSRLKIDLVY
jgi:hypothetical protein